MSQFLRKVTLVVEGATDGLDLSQFRIVFESQQSDYQTLNSLRCRVYNLSDDTAQKIQKEYSRVTLSGGYQNGDSALIFDGLIKQVKRGREDQTETFVEIFAADGDLFYNFGTINKTLASGWTQQQAAEAIAKDGSVPLEVGNVKFSSILNPLPRGKVMYGMAKLQLRNVVNSTETTWSVQNGKLTITPITSYQENEAVVINSATGMIGLPVQTEDGIYVSTLLNPKIQIGTQIQIDQKSIQQASIPNDLSFLSLPKDQLDQTNFFPPTSADGFYKVIVAEHRGDTRGNTFQTDITALAIDKSAAPDQSVKAAG